MPSFSGLCTTLVYILVLLFDSVRAASGSGYVYSLSKDWSGSTFFDDWNFFSGVDPNKGFVSYVDKQTAFNLGLASVRNGNAIMRVDSTNTYNPNTPYQGNTGYGRKSVRISSQSSIYHGLLIADIQHMPYGCGTWPAFWTLGAQGNWPNSGEIDIVEGVNNRANPLAVLHTGGQCKIAGDSRTMTGSLQNNDCYYDVATGQGAVGCAVLDTDPQSYGSGLNNAGGSVFAMEWNSDAIKVWSFPASNVPNDITTGKPDPSGWGLPAQTFNGPGCDLDANIKAQNIIFNTNFCGDFGDAVWSSEGCAAKTGYGTCADYVARNPSAFADAYWEIGYLRHFIRVAAPVTTSSTTTVQTTISPTTVSTAPSFTTRPSTTTPVTTASSSSASVIVDPIPSTTQSMSSSLTSTRSTRSPIFISGVTRSLSSTSTSEPTSSTYPSVIVSPIIISSSLSSYTPLSPTVVPPTTSYGPPSTTGTFTVGPIITSIPTSSTTSLATTKLTNGIPECSYFLPPLGGEVPITPGWNATRGENWSPATINKPSVPTDTWTQWSNKETTTTITKVWVEPCETGYTTKTIHIVTTHCGCKETPLPTIPVKVITTECPEEWGFKTPVVVTIPDIPTPAATWVDVPAKPTKKVTEIPVPDNTWVPIPVQPIKPTADHKPETWVEIPAKSTEQKQPDPQTWVPIPAVPTTKKTGNEQSWSPVPAAPTPKKTDNEQSWSTVPAAPTPKKNDNEQSWSPIPAAPTPKNPGNNNAQTWSPIPAAPTTSKPTTSSKPSTQTADSETWSSWSVATPEATSQIWKDWKASTTGPEVPQWTGGAGKVEVGSGVICVVLGVIAFLL